MMVDMKVSGLTIDPFTNMPILVLKDCDGQNAMPIWIGLIEASAIATELERIQLKRPMTHDLMHNMLGHVGARIDRVEVHDLRDNTFYAMIVLTCSDGKIVEIDSRPSDAIALALRAQAPIRVARKVIDRARKMDLRLEKANGNGTNGKANGKSNGANGKSNGANGKSNSAKAQYAEFLENLSDDDFGKWKM
jgi:bifunctional DNase/RNase